MRNWTCVLLLACCSAEPVRMPTEEMVRIDAKEIRGALSQGFWLDRQVVSSRDFNFCVDAGVCRSERIEARLVDGARVTWIDALGYCRWRGARLPTNLELFHAEPSLRLDGEVVWSSDVDLRHPDRRLTQYLSSLPRGWTNQWPPPDLDARSELATSTQAFRCAR